MCGERCPLMATMRDGETRETHMFLRHADGHRQPVCVRTSPLRDPFGKIIGAVESFSDDTAVRAAQARVADLERLALVDPLTGLGNRRYLDMQVDSWIRDWSRTAVPFGVLFVDLDHFKQVNDTHGHDVGDEALAMVARTLTFGIRAGDILARYGGEEFVVLVRAETKGLTATAERLRSQVAASQLVAAQRRIGLTVSVGGATMADGDSAASLLRRADVALYRAKRAGRNRVEISDGPDAPGAE
jgi:diguanylate cyclase (GGDEF)-like protein